MAGERAIITVKRVTRPVLGFILILCAVSVIGSELWSASEEKENKPKKPRFLFTEHTVQDTVARLMWTLDGGVSDETYSLIDAEEYIVVLNKERFAGYTDWRLPSREEMLSLAEHARSLGFTGMSTDRTMAAALQRIGISSVRPVEYWTSTLNIYDASEAWIVDMEDGSVSTGDRTLYLSVWPVRSMK